MTPAVFVLLSLAGGVGAALRLLTDGAVRGLVGDRMPWGTIAINLLGSLLLGLLTGLATAALVGATWRVVLGIGLLGGFTTFSTATFETLRLLQQRRIGAGVVNGLGVLLAGTALAWAGFALGTGF